MNELMVVKSEKKDTSKNRAALQYCFRYLIFVICFYPCYAFVLFKRVSTTLSLDESRLILGLTMALAMWLGCILNCRFPERNRSYPALAAALFGYAVYTIISYWNLPSFRVDFFIEVAGIMLIMFVEKQVSGKVHVNSSLIAFSFTLLVCVWFTVYSNTGLMSSSAEYIQETESITETQKQEMSVKIQDFNNLTLQEKLSVLQLVVNSECGSLGIVPPLVEVGTFTDDYVGEFHRKTNEIVIDERFVKYATREENLAQALHEVRHAYQIELVTLYESLPKSYKSLYIFNDRLGELDISVLATELGSYTSDPDKGYCEQDARRYAIETAEFYVEWADQYN